MAQNRENGLKMRKNQHLGFEQRIDDRRDEIDLTILGDNPASLRIAFFAIVMGAMIWIGFFTALVILLF